MLLSWFYYIAYSKLLTWFCYLLTVPNPVRNLMARPESTTSVKVQWSHPEGHRPYFTYRIQTSTRAELVFNTSSIVVTGLDPGTQYSFNVKAVAAEGSHSTTQETFSYTSKSLCSVVVKPFHVNK